MSNADPEHRYNEEAPAAGDDEDTEAQVAPIVRLDEVAVTTGEEDEDTILDLEWRKAGGGVHSGTINNAQPVHDHIPSPTISASHKKQKTSQYAASLSLGAPSPVVHPPTQLTSSALRNGLSSGAKTKKPKPVSVSVLEDHENEN
ncbi:unnamed protein product [Lupinus luteus]|uniref:Uncharacterized protein n=1 Tax=Lupinus luteus TaxID=3873 RepID=A0AAV1YIG5_LUPLU